MAKKYSLTMQDAKSGLFSDVNTTVRKFTLTTYNGDLVQLVNNAGVWYLTLFVENQYLEVPLQPEEAWNLTNFMLENVTVPVTA